MSLNLKNKIKILSDFRSNLEMFSLTNKHIQIIKKKFPNINFEFVNFDSPKVNYDCKIYWGTKINNEIFRKCKNLSWIQFGSVGVDKLDYSKINLKEIKVTNSKGINSNAVLNLLIIFLFDTSKKILLAPKKLNRNLYEKYFKNTKDLNDQKISVLGFGNIAQELRKFSKNYNLDITYFSRRILKNKDILKQNFFKKDVKKFDTIINLLEFNQKNQNYFDKEIFARMKSNVNLILLGRLRTINLLELYNFLKKNKKSTCYIDPITDQSNVKILKKILKLKNVYFTPHIGGYFREYWKYQLEIFCTNLKLFLNGKKMKNLVPTKKLIYENKKS